MDNEKLIMSIDPGIHNCGYCFMTENMKLIKYGLIQSKKQEGWVDKCKNVYFKLYQEYTQYFPKTVFIEYPGYHAGQIAYAARESGAIAKLCFLCGGIHSLLSEIATVELILPSKWKGQLKKEMVRKRLYNIYPEIEKENLDHNIIDAIGIGYYTLENKNDKNCTT